jgi:hypothetical protein
MKHGPHYFAHPIEHPENVEGNNVGETKTMKLKVSPATKHNTPPTKYKTTTTATNDENRKRLKKSIPYRSME